MVTINNPIDNKVGGSNSGVTNTLTVDNASNTASSQALVTITVGGGTAGDAFIQHVVSGVTTWSEGVDNSASDAYVIAASATLGTSNAISINASTQVVTAVTGFISSGIITMSSGQVVKRTVPGAYPYTVLSTDYIVEVDTSAARTINLPNAPTTGTVYFIKDTVGSAPANNISVTTLGGVVTIDGTTTQTMNVAFSSMMVYFNGTSYFIL